MASLKAQTSISKRFHDSSRDTADNAASAQATGRRNGQRLHRAPQRRTRSSRTATAATLDASRLAELTPAFSHGPANTATEASGLLEAAASLRCKSPEDLSDVLAALIMSECVYKKVEGIGHVAVAAKVSEFASAFPPGWIQLESLQITLSDIPQHYMIATTPTSLVVAFMGTKRWEDLLADANLLHTPVWAESAALAADASSIPAAHRGFLERARAIHVEQLYELAVSRGLRLVLCGHSLGGAVAKLCTLRLLRELPDWPRPRVRCIAFATPAVGNAALAEMVANAGWADHFASYYLPEDQLVRLISFSQARTPTPSSSPSSPSASASASASGDVAAGVSDAESAGSGAGRPLAAAALRQREQLQVENGGLPRVESSSSVGSTASLASTGSGSLLGSAGSGSLLGTAGSGVWSPWTSSVDGSGGSGTPLARRSLSLPVSRSSSLTGLQSAAAGLARLTHTESLDEEQAGAAMEEILAPGPDALEAAAAPGGVAALAAAAAASHGAAAGGGLGGEGSGSDSDGLEAAQRQALYGGGAGGSWGVRLALKRRRAIRRLRHLAAKARIPLPKALLPVSRYHTFGEQWFITEDGALSPEQLERRQQRERASQQQPQPAEAPDGARGLFSHHRMLAYRQRHLDLVRSMCKRATAATGPADCPSEMSMDGAAEALASLEQLASSSNTNTAPPRGAGAGSAAHSTVLGAPAPRAVQLIDSLVPRIAVHRASLRGILPCEPEPEAAEEAQPQPQTHQPQTRAHQAQTHQAQTQAHAAAGTEGHLVQPSASTPAMGAPATAATAGAAVSTVKGGSWWAGGRARSAPAASTHVSPGRAAAPADAAAEPMAAAPAPSLTPPSSASPRQPQPNLLRWMLGGAAADGAGHPAGRGRSRSARSRGAAAGTADEPVQLELELEGANLQYCRKVSVSLVRSSSSNSSAGASAVNVAAGASVAAPAAMASGSLAATSQTPSELSAAPADAASPAAPHSHSAAAPATPEQPAHVPAAPETGMSTTTSTEVPCEVVQVLYAQPYTPAANPPPLHPVSLISNTLHHFTGSLIRRYLRPADAAAAAAAAATAAAPGLGLGLARGMPWRRWGRGRGGRGGAAAAAEGGATAASAAANGSSSEEEGEGVEVPADAAMPSRLLLRVTLPRSIAAGLLDGSLRGDAHLAVSARSDFHAVADVRVGVARHRVAILGTSPYAASLVQAALAAPAALAVAGRGESEAMGVAAAGAGLFGLPWLALPLAWSRPARAAGAAASAEAGAVPGGGAAAAPVWGVRLPFRAGRAGRQQAACAADAVGAPAVSSAASAAGALEAQVDAAAENTVAAALAAILAGTLGWPHSPQGDDGVIGVGPYGPAPRGYDRTRVVCADAPGDAPLRPAAAVAAAYYAAGLPPRPRPRPGLVQTALQFSGSLLRTKSQRRGEQQQQLQQVAAGLAGAAGVAERAAEEAAAQLLAASSEPAAAGRIARLPLLAARKQRASALGSRQGASGAVTSGDAGTAGQQARVPLPLPPQLAASLRAWAEVLPALGRWQLESGLRPTFAAAAVGAAAAIVAGTTGVATAVGAAAMLAGALGAATAPTHDGSAAVVSNMAVSVAATVAATAAAAASAVAGSEATIAAATAAAAAATLAAAMATTVVGSSVLTGAHGGVQAPSTTAAAGGRLAQASSPRPLMLGGRFPVLRAPELVAAAAPVSVSNGTGTSSLVTGAGVAAGPPGPLPPKYPGASPAPPRPPSRLAGPVAGAGAAAPRWVLRFGAAPAASPGIAPGGTPRPGSGSGSGGNNTQARGGAGGAGKALGRGWVLWWRPSASAAGSAAPAMPMDPQPAAPQRWGAQAAGRRVVKQQPLTAPPVVDAAAVAPPSARAATPLAHLRSQLLGSLSRGSGRAVLPLPPALAAEGLEFCNAMLEPLQPPAAAAAAAAIATAARPAVGLLRPLQPLQAQVRQMPQNYPGKPQPKGSTGRGAVAPVAVEAVPAAAVAAAPLAGQPPVAGLAPVVAMRRVTEGLRRQLLLHRGVWWRALVGGVVGALMRPVALVGMLGRLPIMGLQAFRRTGAQPLAAAGPAGAAGAAALAAASAAAAQLQATAAAAQPPPALTLPAAPAAAAAAAAGWEAVVVVGSCRDPLRALRTKDMAALRAHADTCPLVPVLLTCAGTPPGRRAAARDTLAAACGVEPGAVRVLVVEEALLHRPAALVPHTDLPTVWEQLGGCAGAAELRRAVRAAVTATRAAPEAATVTMPTTAEAAAAPWGVLAATGVAGSDGVGRAVGSRVEAVPGRVLAAGGAAAVAAEGTRRVRYHPLLSNSRA